ncbi:bifunctional protein tyrosine phosphatase family protein/NAD(P)/FAD-dependent oxidoreductase [Nitratireductor sp. XY-223]|uniref:bifunctional protein tyrosine phosphatase family protein/NAD(P)/FAD-dependent oxidoreductase n=1 Tax=Nitratireductor sp. XY-223 TaxID=2561926 RepID=UPI0010A9AD5A|nr:bifunctional protein tyrosine phosphatase family protein/NAD(P)/FAD-dependent oxidoreductase [Nitratireductor sp. XY-223]
MEIKHIDATLAVSPQILPSDIAAIANQGFRSIVCNRPDGEGADQPAFKEISDAAAEAGLECHYLPVTSGRVKDSDAVAFGAAMQSLPKPTLAYCRTGTRSATLWSLDEGAHGTPLPSILETARKAGYDMSGVVRRIANGGKTPTDTADASHDIVIVGGGAAGIAAASSLHARDGGLDIAIIDPADIHYYQPGWTMVGGGIFDASTTAKTMASLIPRNVHWIKAAVSAFEPQNNAVILDGCRVVKYNRLIVAPGLKLDWNGVDGLVETLGKNGVTSNYRYDLAPYTWKLVSELKSGRAVFTQPPMPIKCAGAPQKALYLSADHWRRTGVLDKVDIRFCNAGNVLFGVKEYVPALMDYIERYRAELMFGHRLVRIDGPSRKAWFAVGDEAGKERQAEIEFDMIHVVPPQTAPDFIRVSPLADAAGWVDVDQNTLRHKSFDNIWSLGDVMNAPNAKTAAAARKQAPTVANNLLQDMGRARSVAHYDGYGSCPLTVERGKIVLAEFGYGGKLLPSMPTWLINGRKPTRAAWFLKEKILPPMYWRAMLRGKEWLARPDMVG